MILTTCTHRVFWVVFCTVSVNCTLDQPYLDLYGPRFSGDYRQDVVKLEDDLNIISYNLEFAEAVEQAIEVLSTPPLADADVILMQEMDAPATDAISEALGLTYVYYPATVKNEQDFGNAVLSRFEILDDAKVILPHADPYTGSRRVAVRATLRIEQDNSQTSTINTYSVHNATMALGLRGRLEQAETIAKDAHDLEGVTIIGGDFNTADPGSASQTVNLLDDYGFDWISSDAKDTGSGYGQKFTLDYVFGRGVSELHSETFEGDAGSDHQPVWVQCTLN